MHSARVDFLGCPVDGLSMEQALARLEEFVREGTPRHVAVTNANKLWQMEKNPLVAQIVRRASLVLPEKAIVIGSRLLGLGVNHHVGGIMLLNAFLPRAQEKGYRIYFLGAKPEVVQLMVGNLRRDFPGLNIVGWHHGYVPAGDDAEVSESIRQACPDVLFVAMGTPKQEFWIEQHLECLKVPVCMGVGGSFDVLAGLKRDAPDWVRAVAMEWLYRLVQDPGNLWKRYLITMPWLLKKVLLAKTRLAFSGRSYREP
jgi:N-acetylglucosaminyldiphosphoundecaprenol N-acetyl-beta-D-mannosaminyltransferase